MSGRITDASGAVIVDAEVEIKNVETGISTAVKTNQDGLYTIPSLHPGHYLINVRKVGFKSVTITEVTLNVQDNVVRNFALQIGSVSETVTITADQLNINTTDATVSTVVDRQFAENLPMNGRSFQSLIELTPGVTLTATGDGGQFSINGQRTDSNYWMVDGVSANIGIGITNQTGNALNGAVGSFSALGGTNGLVSVDAMQEFRIQTSTYAPEFGRTPGGQISIVTRSGSNQFHGSAFDYFRNDVLDANNWFADSAGLPKPRESQNDFGGTFSGPILKDKTFFFFSYEGLRLRLPGVGLTTVPDLQARQNALPALQPFLNAYPLPTPGAPDDLATGVAQFDASYSNSASLDAYSLRIDHKLSNELTLFGRYNYSPSSLIQRGSQALSTVSSGAISTQTATVGSTWAISPTTADDLRFNYSRTSAKSREFLDNFGGAVPLTSLPFPSPYTDQNGAFQFFIVSLEPIGLNVGPTGKNLQRQINIIDSFSTQKGPHSLKFGVDYRRLSPIYGNPQYDLESLFRNVPSAETGTPIFNFVSGTQSVALLFHNLGLFTQDTWRVTPRLTLTYGLRWDLDFAPSSNPSLAAVTGFNLDNLSNLALAPKGTPPFKTTYGNFAPRLGAAYVLHRSGDSQTVLRSGFGVFYDLASSETGNLLYYYYYPLGTLSSVTGAFPPTAAAAAPVPPGTFQGNVFGFDPNLKLPYTWQWNVAVEQSLGNAGTLSLSYIGASGRRLFQSAIVNNPNATIQSAQLVTNAAISDYNALQVQFQRRLSRGLQALASYTFSHSIDDASTGNAYGATGNGTSSLLLGVINQNRGPSDFDIRHSFSAGVTYDGPVPKWNAFTTAILRGWSTQSFIIARSALPVTLYDGSFFAVQSAYTSPRPDVLPGQPFYLYGSQYPGGKAFNPNAFTGVVGDGRTPAGTIPVDQNGNATREGDLGRNALRGFGLTQWDFAIHRDFPVRESLKLQFRAEMFNVLNHPNFGPQVADLSQSNFGVSNQTFGQYVTNGTLGTGGLSSLYQVGGPRSIQFALKLIF